MSNTACEPEQDQTQLEIVSYGEIVFDDEFTTYAEADNFYAWWANQVILPQGSATLRSPGPYPWREAHPLERAKLNKAQERLVATRYRELAEREEAVDRDQNPNAYVGAHDPNCTGEHCSYPALNEAIAESQWIYDHSLSAVEEER